jgi:hypothetical protein
MSRLLKPASVIHLFVVALVVVYSTITPKVGLEPEDEMCPGGYRMCHGVCIPADAPCYTQGGVQCETAVR